MVVNLPPSPFGVKELPGRIPLFKGGPIKKRFDRTARLKYIRGNPQPPCPGGVSAEIVGVKRMREGKRADFPLRKLYNNRLGLFRSGSGANIFKDMLDLILEIAVESENNLKGRCMKLGDFSRIKKKSPASIAIGGNLHRFRKEKFIQGIFKPLQPPSILSHKTEKLTGEIPLGIDPEAFLDPLQGWSKRTGSGSQRFVLLFYEMPSHPDKVLIGKELPAILLGSNP
jgi:hypothetical protein